MHNYNTAETCCTTSDKIPKARLAIQLLTGKVKGTKTQFQALTVIRAAHHLTHKVQLPISIL